MILDHGEAFNAAVAGLQRRFRAIARNAKSNDGELTKDRMVTDIHGAIAEAMVAKALGVYCNLASADRGIADVGTNIEVRSTPNPNGPLVIRPRDKDNYKYYLVAGLYPNAKIIGWKRAQDCKKDCYWVHTDSKGQPLEFPYWAVPQSDLTFDLIEVEL